MQMLNYVNMRRMEIRKGKLNEYAITMITYFPCISVT